MNALRRFLQIESSSGIVLFLATVLALILANSAAFDSYTGFLNTYIAGMSVHHWINDGLMTIFFLVVGMEIKKELLEGELASFQKAALPILVAVGGMAVPAGIYYYFNPTSETASGWGIPMATDIAFALGILSLFGRRIPNSLKVFLLALAIVDDLGAVFVIAIFYTQQISFLYLLSAAILCAVLFVLQKIKIHHLFVYCILGALIWFFTLRSGIHATVAGVVLGFLTPMHFKDKSGNISSPLQKMIEYLHVPVSFMIMPIFALANAGLNLRGITISEQITHSVFQGVFFGLLAGKFIGIFFVSWLTIKLKIAVMPQMVNWLQILGIAALGGVGFTMALFISGLALPVEYESESKLAIFSASIFSAIIGSIFLKIGTKKAHKVFSL